MSGDLSRPFRGITIGACTANTTYPFFFVTHVLENEEPGQVI